MAYLTRETIENMGFKFLGKNVKISEKASIYNCESIELDDFARVDDFCVISGNVSIGRYCHITPYCLLAGGVPGIKLADFSTLAYGVKVFSQSDDYSGETMVNSLIPEKYKNTQFSPVSIKRQTIIGAGSVIMPGIVIEEGCSIGAISLVLKSTKPWGIYAGSPARRIKDRKKDLLALEAKFLEEVNNDSI